MAKVSKFLKVSLARRCKLTRKKEWERVSGFMFEKVVDGSGSLFCGRLMTDIPDKGRKLFASGSLSEKAADGGGSPFCGELMTRISDQDRKLFAIVLVKPALVAESKGFGGHSLLMKPH